MINTITIASTIHLWVVCSVLVWGLRSGGWIRFSRCSHHMIRPIQREFVWDRQPFVSSRLRLPGLVDVLFELILWREKLWFIIDMLAISLHLLNHILPKRISQICESALFNFCSQIRSAGIPSFSGSDKIRIIDVGEFSRAPIASHYAHRYKAIIYYNCVFFRIIISITYDASTCRAFIICG